MNEMLLLAIICAILAIVYGVWSIRWLLAKPEGDETMRAISLAIQEGASAYLRRQYTTIAIVGVVLFAVIYYFIEVYTAVGFAIGAILSGAAGFIGFHTAKRLLADGLGGPEGAVSGVRSEACDLPTNIEAERTETRERDAGGRIAHVNLLFRAAGKLGDLLTPGFA